jgi:hypothetical protein
MTRTTHSPAAADRRRWFLRRRVPALLLVNVAALALVSMMLEAAYRGQWVDFHRADLAASNPSHTLADRSRPTILALGDSFTAGLDNWPARLQRRLGPGERVVNSAVGGTTIRQMRIIADGRIHRFRPRLVICQVYTGNDLADLRHPAATGRTGLLRGLYWSATDRGWLIPWYLNTRLRQTFDRWSRERQTDPAEMERLIAEMEARPFAVDDYSPRSAMLLAASPTLIADQIAVTGETARAWPVYEAELDRLVSLCRDHQTQLLLVVVPHCVQVHPRYADRFRALGATFPDPVALTTAEAPFVARLRAAAASHPGAEVLDALPSLRLAETTGEAVYFANDPHLNRRGRDVLSSVIADAVRTR